MRCQPVVRSLGRSVASLPPSLAPICKEVPHCCRRGIEVAQFTLTAVSAAFGRWAETLRPAETEISV